MARFPCQLQRYPTSAELSEALAGHLAEHLHGWLERPEAQRRPIGLATGRTMEPLYRALVAQLQGWSEPELMQLRQHWCSFNLDEYLGLGADDPRGYRSYMRRHLAGPLRLSDATVHLPDSTASDGAAAAARYSAELQAHGGIGVQLLGLGSNGHVGFNEPPSQSHCGCHEVVLTPATRHQNAALFGGQAEAVPERAITLGLAEILAASEIHLVVTGAGKASILQRLLSLQAPDPMLPASWLLSHPRVWLWCDAAALA